MKAPDALSRAQEALVSSSISLTDSTVDSRVLLGLRQLEVLIEKASHLPKPARTEIAQSWERVRQDIRETHPSPSALAETIHLLAEIYRKAFPSESKQEWMRALDNLAASLDGFRLGSSCASERASFIEPEPTAEGCKPPQ